MNLNTFRKTITVSVLGLAFLLGTTEIANAQTDKKEQREQQKAAKRQREAQMRRAGIEDLRIKADQKREQMRIKKIPMITSDANRYRINRNGTYYETNNRGGCFKVSGFGHRKISFLSRVAQKQQTAREKVCETNPDVEW